MSKSSRKQQNRAQRSFPWFAVIIGGVVVIGIAAVVFAAVGGNDEETSGEQTRDVTVTGSPVAAFTGAVPDEAFGTEVPELSGENFAGDAVAITNDGRPKAVAFLAHWCPHCQAEVPRLADYLEQQGLPDEVDLYLVPTSTDRSQPNYPPEPWLVDAGLGDIPTLVDDDNGTAFTAAGGTGFPYFLFVDSDNNVSGRLSGELPEGAFDAIFTALAEGEPITSDIATGGASSDA